MNRRRKSGYLQALERRRQEAARQEQPEGTSEPQETEAPTDRILVERPAPLFPNKPRRKHWK